LEYALVEEGMELNIGNDFPLDDVDNIFSYTLRMFLYAKAYHDKRLESVPLNEVCVEVLLVGKDFDFE